MRFLLILLLVLIAVSFFTVRRESADTPASAPAAVESAADNTQPGAVTAGTRPVVELPPNFYTEIEAAARTAGVEITSLTVQSDGASVNLRWPNTVAASGGIFLSECQARGLMRDFLEEAPLHGMMIDGRPHYAAGFFLRF